MLYYGDHFLNTIILNTVESAMSMKYIPFCAVLLI